MTKRSIAIDRALANEAAEALGTSTLTSTVDAALREIVERRRGEGFLAYFSQRRFTAEEREAMGRAWH
jgi:Arc/MetJ family transcription regulator